MPNFPELPISSSLPSIQQIVKEGHDLILQAEPGAGKTTLVPLCLLSQLKDNQRILLLEPRRLATKSAAKRMAELLNEPVGKTVGYRIKGESKVSSETKIEVITEGILTRLIQNSPELESVHCIIFDEFHERSLHADLGLAFSLDVQMSLREDLRIIIMSATLNHDLFKNILPNAHYVQSKGRAFPVAVSYLSDDSRQDWRVNFVKALHIALAESAGDILVFVAGVRDIRWCEEQIQSHFSTSELMAFPLYAAQPWQLQQQIFTSQRVHRRVIIATNIAETSITLPNISAVIDTGYEKQSQFDPNVGFDRLQLTRISEFSAEQRMGRAGRTQPGHCYRLWSNGTVLRKEKVPEIQRADLSTFVLEIGLWGIQSLDDFYLIERPNAGAFSQAKELLILLGCLDENNQPTLHGIQCLALGVHPRFAHMLLHKETKDLLRLKVCIVVLLENRERFVSLLQSNHDFSVALMAVIEYTITHPNKSDARFFKKSALQLWEKLQGCSSGNFEFPQHTKGLARCLIDAFPDRIAIRKNEQFQMANGHGVSLFRENHIKGDALIAIELMSSKNGTLITSFVELNPQDLDIIKYSYAKSFQVISWDQTHMRVVTETQIRLNQLILQREFNKQHDKNEIESLLLSEIQKLTIKALPISERVFSLINRIETLQFARVEYAVDLSSDWLNKNMGLWLKPFLQGKRSVKEIHSEDINNAICSCLTWQQSKQLDGLAPEYFAAPSGRNVKIDYSRIEQPLISIKLQEMFGYASTPSIAQGKIPLQIHLMSPANRPLQITQDLMHFWQNGYNDVKKEMKGRYPKHPWPDNPLLAIPTSLTKKRMEK